MAERLKIDSNETGLSYAEETSIGVLPVTPVWIPLEPNEYEDFGGELTLLARNPINASRQRKKGVITDLDASGGFQSDFTQSNFQDLLQGVMFANFREKPTADVNQVSGTAYEVDSGDEVPFPAGSLIFASGFVAAANNGLKIVTSVAAGEVRAAGLVAAGGDVGTITLVGVQGAAGDLDITQPVGDYPYMSSTVLDFTDYGFVPGEWIFVGGDQTAEKYGTANDGWKRIYSIAADRLTFDRSVGQMVTVADAAKTIRLFFGRVLKNELGALIVRHSYQIERQLGAPDTSNPSDFQSEYLVGAIANEFTLNVETADKLTADISFMAIDNEQRTAATGIKSGTRQALVETDAFNTSTDFAAMRLAVHEDGVANPTPLFGYVTDLAITINNNVSPNKAVAVLGAFDVTVGTFEVSAEVTAYFSTIEAVQAVRDNEDASLYAAVYKNNAGFVLDLPLVALGDARSEVEQDEPIMIPLQMDAATAARINANTDYTAMWVFFDYLPELAGA